MVRRVPGVAWLDLAAEAEQREQAGLRTARWLRLKTEGPRRPRVGATGHLGDEGCRSHPRARVLVTGDSREGLQSGCAQSGSPGVCMHTCVGLCPAWTPTCRRGLERQIHPKSKSCSTRTPSAHSPVRLTSHSSGPGPWFHEMQPPGAWAPPRSLWETILADVSLQFTKLSRS